MKRFAVSITEQTTTYRTEYIDATDMDKAWEKAQDEFEYKSAGRTDEDERIEVTDIVEE